MRGRTLVFMALTVPFVAEASAPPLIPVTGYLTDDAGAPIDGTTTLDLNLYTSASGTSTLWTEVQDVDVVNGQFTVYLGDETALGLDLFRVNSTVFLGIAVESGAEMSPRFEIATSPFAAYAQFCDDAASLGGFDAVEYRLTSDPVDWTDLQGLPAGLDDGDADTTYTAGDGLTLAGTEFAVNPTSVEGWARGVAYDSVTELRADLDAIYAARQTCTPNQVLMADGSGAWLCTDSTALPLNEAVIDSFVGNNGYAQATALTALTGRVTTAEGTLSTVQSGLSTTNANLAAEITARTSAVNTLTTNLNAEIAARIAAVSGEATTRANADTTEATARANADTTEATARANAVTTEATARASADTAITNNLATPGTFNASSNPVDWTKLKNAPAGMMRNLGAASQTGVLSAVGNVWRDIPGATVNVTVPTGGLTLRMRASGSTHAEAGSPAYTHCGVRFVVDGTPYGNASWGDVLFAISTSGSGSGWHEAWAMQRDLPQAAGVHTVQLQMTAWDGSSASCYSSGDPLYSADLTVEGF